MKIVRCVFLASLVLACSLPMVGCGLFAQGAGVEEYVDKDGVKRVRISETSLADKATGLLYALGPWGIAAGAALGVAKRVIRHREILAHGQRDDDFDGMPDDPPPPAAGAPAAEPPKA